MSRDTITDAPLDDDVKRSLCRERVTLDGRPARVSGALRDFALVTRVDGMGGSVEFAWETVQFVVLNRGGRFQS